MVDVVELKYQVVEVARQKYVCGCGGAVETAVRRTNSSETQTATVDI